MSALNICRFAGLSTFLVLISILLLPDGAHGQLSRGRMRCGSVYRGSYQRMAGGGNAGQRFSIRNGALYASGRNNLGQLGDGSNTDRPLPVRIGTAADWVLLSSDSGHTLGLRADGTLWSWGFNVFGQLGDGTTTSHSSPVQIGTGTGWISVACGLCHSLALRSDGTVWSWGLNASGQLGSGSAANASAPAQIAGLSNITAIAAGREHSLALRADGTVWSWGLNASGQLGNGGGSNQASPVQIGTATSWAFIAAGGNSSFAIRANGSLWAFGDNQYGQLGDGSSVSRNTPVQIGTDLNWVSVAPGNTHTLALKSSGTLWSWGGNASGQLGNGSATGRSAPAQVGSRSDYVQLQAGEAHSTALTADGLVYGWGGNAHGALGTGTAGPSLTPLLVENGTAQWLTASISYHNMLLKSDGSLWGVGFNGAGCLGDASNADRSIPVQIGQARNWVGVACGEQFTLALTADGKLYSWGDNSYGQLGSNSNTSRNVPAQIGAAISWSQVATGQNHAAGISGDGRLFAWGNNSVGQIGDGTSGNQRKAPTQIGTASDWVGVACAANSTFALKADGSLYSWGYNLTGTLGIGSTANRTTPQLVSGSNFVSLSAGGNFVLALKANGTLWAWGFNGYGQLGDGGSTNRTSPVQIGSATNWMTVSCGGLHANALTADGKLYVWGNNASGELGDSTTTNQSTPQFSGQSEVVGLFCSAPVSTNSAAIPATRSKICLSGYNYYGELGDGGNTNGYSFNCVNAICAVYGLPGGARMLTLPMTGPGSRTDFQSGCELMAAVTPSGASPVSGDLTASSWIESSLPVYGGRPVLARHFELTPAQNAATATATVTLYVSQADLNAYNAAPSHGYNFPSSTADPLNEADNIRILQFGGSSSDGTGLPATYSGPVLKRRPSAVVYDSVSGYWAVSFPVSGFSGFFLQSSVFALPVGVLRFDAWPVSDHIVALEWQLAESAPETQFTVERSADGTRFEPVGSLGAAAGRVYGFRDNAPLTGRSWYRVRTDAADGEVGYSALRRVEISRQGGLRLGPSPARDWLELRSDGRRGLASIVDLQGRVLLETELGPNTRIDVRGLYPGIYLLKTDAGETLRFLKQ